MRDKRFIAFSLWGTDPTYNVGIIKNITLAKELYIGWQVIVYYNYTVPGELISSLISLNVITIEIKSDLNGMFWRFLAADLDDCKYVIFRDCDSRLTKREYLAVSEWINSGHIIHVMKDHPYHYNLYENQKFYILGGMWGIKGGILNMEEMITNYKSKHDLKYGSDQFFLNELYEKHKNQCMEHHGFYSDKKFPVGRTGYRFIGERMDQFDHPATDEWKAIKDYYRSKKYVVIMFNKIKTTLKQYLRLIND